MKKLIGESAYELLNEKIEKAEAEEAKAAAKKEREKLKRSASSSRSSRRRSSATEKAVIKVLTSATFIRGALGVLNKLLK